MKYCIHCGNELMDEAVICPKCGCPVDGANYNGVTTNSSNTLKVVAKVFMIISCIFTGFYLIPLCWTIPMTVSYSKKIRNNEPVSTGFKVCTLLFVNAVAGILMLCDRD